MNADADLDARARAVLGRALDAVDLAGEPVPARPDGRAAAWPWALAATVVVAAVVGFVLVVPDGGDDVAVSTADPTRCVAEAEVVVPAGRIANGERPDGGPWEVHVLVTASEVNVFNVLPDRHGNPAEGSGVGRQRPAPGSRAEEFLYALSPAPGGFVLGAELPPGSVRVEAAGADGTVVTACAHPVAGVDGVRYAGAFLSSDASEPPVLRAFAADGTVLAVADDIPAGIWRSGAAGASSTWRLEPAATATTATTAGTQPPVPAGGDPCGDDPPPFTITDLPDGIDPTPVLYREWRRANTPPGHDIGSELYDPVFLYVDPGDPDRRIDVYHGNSWRLARTLRQQQPATVLGHDAWLSDVVDGSALLDFQVTGSGDPCDYWSLSNAGPVTEAELLAAAASIIAD